MTKIMTSISAAQARHRNIYEITHRPNQNINIKKRIGILSKESIDKGLIGLSIDFK